MNLIIENNLNSIFEKYAIVQSIIQDYYIYKKCNELKDTSSYNDDMGDVVENIRQHYFYVFILRWCALFGNDNENFHWKKLIGDDTSKFYNQYELDKKEIDKAWENAINWRNSVIARIGIKKGKYPKADDLLVHFNLCKSFYTECYDALKNQDTNTLFNDCVIPVEDYEKQCIEFSEKLLRCDG